MVTFDVIVTMALMTLVVTSWPSVGAWKKDIKVKYYSSVVLRCHENLTVIPDTTNVFWLTRDGEVLQETTPAADFSPSMQLVNGAISMLNVSQVDDDLFGYYTCVMLKRNGQVAVARWGLNVNGADFSHLEEQYRKNAVVGAIAASVMIVLLGGACLVWHFRFSKRAQGGQKSGSVDGEEELGKPSTASSVFQNPGFDEPLPQVEGREVSELKDSSPRTQSDRQENGVTESCKM